MMMNIFKMLLLSGIVIFSSSCQKNTITEAPINLLTNGDIESGILNWGFLSSVQNNPNSYVSEATEEFAASPKKSLKISCTKVNDTGAFGYFVQSFLVTDLKTGSKLTLKAKVKGVNLTGNGLSIALRGDMTGVTGSRFFQSSQDVTPLRGTFDFREVTVTLDAYQGNADRIIVFLLYLPNTTGTAYFDDISLTSSN